METGFNLSLVVMLVPTDKQPTFVARFDPGSNSPVIRSSQKDYAISQTAEVWLIAGDDKPRSLGGLNGEEEVKLLISEDQQAKINAGVLLVISLEPPGGSPTGQQTGPVIALGSLDLI